MVHDRPSADISHLLPRGWTLAVAIVATTLLGVGLVSLVSLLSVLLDGLAALLVMGPAMLMGLWLVPLFRFQKLPLRWHFLLGSALGIGAVSTLVLVLGLAGFLNRPLWVVLLASFAVSGYVRLRMLLADASPVAGNSSEEVSSAGASGYLWFLVIPFLVLAILAASTAPGFLWVEEGFGYDALEYHLQLPKEYLEAGRMGYLPHNVYANLPANVEMLYMLAMIVVDDVHDAGTIAHMIHLLLGVLTVFAAWVAGCERSPRAGVIGGVVTATAGWMTYLCGLAYVENGMLFFGMTAVAVLLRSCERKCGMGWIVAAGVLAGLACGCKSTALPMIAMPLCVMAVVGAPRGMRLRVTHGVAFLGVTIVAFLPWLIKNQVMTGNPVFPLGNSYVQATPPGFGMAETEAWDRGHELSARERTGVSPRLRALLNHVIGDEDQRFGPAIFLLALVGLFGRRRDRVDAVLLVMVAIQIGVWLFATHLLARFAVVLLIPFGVLSGRALGDSVGDRLSIWRRVLVGVLVLGSVWNAAWAIRLYQREGVAGAPASLIYNGEVSGYGYLGVIHRDLPEDVRILLVGDAKAFYFKRAVDYCVAFNRNPLFELIDGGATVDELLRWLRDRGYTHVLVHWSELRRLAGTYGFSPPVEPTQIERLFGRLLGRGLSVVQEFQHEAVRGRYVTLYEVSGR